MILSVSLSKPCGNICEQLGKPFEKIKIKIENVNGKISYFAQFFTKTQVFHEHWTPQKLDSFLSENVGKTFKNCVKKTESEEITILTNKKGKSTELRKKTVFENKKNADSKNAGGSFEAPTAKEHISKGNTSNGSFSYSLSDLQSTSDLTKKNLKILPEKKKKYILQEGKPVPFLVTLGIMSAEGKVFNSKYDKFRQINRFLEFLDDVLDSLLKNNTKNTTESENNFELDDKTCLPTSSVIKICDFGCGKSYLTFAIHYYLTEIRHIPCEIEGLDLKKDVISYCNELTEKLGLKGLHFKVGNIADYSGKSAPDIVVTLHACDTATDFALKYAVERGAKVILSVPCCQHEVNSQLEKKQDSIFEPLLKWGLIREKFSALLTDSLRGEWLENCGYKVQMLEFIDESHTPKNILIRAVKKNEKQNFSGGKSREKTPEILDALKILPEIWKN